LAGPVKELLFRRPSSFPNNFPPAWTRYSYYSFRRGSEEAVSFWRKSFGIPRNWDFDPTAPAAISPLSSKQSPPHNYFKFGSTSLTHPPTLHISQVLNQHARLLMSLSYGKSANESNKTTDHSNQCSVRPRGKTCLKATLLIRHTSPSLCHPAGTRHRAHTFYSSGIPHQHKFPSGDDGEHQN